MGLALVGCGDDEPNNQTNPAMDMDVDEGEDDADLPDVQEDAEQDAEPDAPCGVECEPSPISIQDPTTGQLHAYPDDFWTVEDPQQPSGVRVNVTLENMISILDFPASYQSVFTDLSLLDGFGTSAGGFFRFSKTLDPASIPSGGATTESDSPVIFGALGPDGFEPVPVEIKMTDDDQTVVFRPMVPLPAASRAVAALTTAVVGVDGEPIEAGEYTRAMLDGNVPEGVEHLQGRYGEAVEALVASGRIDGADEIGAMTVFTTQSIVQDNLQIAQDIQARQYEVAERLGCTPRANDLRCTITFEVNHYRDELARARTEPQGSYTLSAEVFMPTDRSDGPAPVVIFGHGLGGDRGQARRLAEVMAPLGLASVALDAPEHGEHPAKSGGDGVLGLARFFGFDDLFNMSAFRLRDNWSQATHDKLALVELLKSGVDVDGDGEIDLEQGPFLYLGASLGGIMGTEFLALSPDVEAAILIVPGARITDIMQFGETFGPILRILTPAGVTPGDVDRFWPVLQSAVERGDGVNFARHVLEDRLVGQAPSVLLGVVPDDDIVPEVTHIALARAMGVVHVEPVVRPVELLEVVPAPMSGNIAPGVTGAFLQFDFLDSGPDAEPSNHGDIAESPAGVRTWLHFMRTHREDGQAEVIDPYDIQ